VGVEGRRRSSPGFPSADPIPGDEPSLDDKRVGSISTSEPLPTPRDGVIRWSPDGCSLLVVVTEEVPARVERLEVATGKREPLRTIGPADLAGVLNVGPLVFANDRESYAYACCRIVSHLFLVEGAR